MLDFNSGRVHILPSQIRSFGDLHSQKLKRFNSGGRGGQAFQKPLLLNSSRNNSFFLPRWMLHHSNSILEKEEDRHSKNLSSSSDHELIPSLLCQYGFCSISHEDSSL
ncbi:hypothetical protein AVEN_78072-1 [Araneus ventricosus]|uniref:Uncharacterized protein n=1 Tax=Araneus ventricosus TaxID=182803 RepID=A0A4Y2FAQ7_ARAVE|nr:hypothetical protein AVEN_78072-1 [Araneus ventricosus]